MKSEEERERTKRGRGGIGEREGRKRRCPLKKINFHSPLWN
jgi:hypothetical protein